MKCFNHAEEEAIGLCKACYKGLCLDCAADLGHGLACKSTHIEAVENLNSLITRNVHVTKQSGRGLWIAPAFNTFMGTVFLFMGGMSDKRGSSLMFVFGAGFLVYAAVILKWNRRLWGK